MWWLAAATMALLTDFETLAKMTSVGTMFVTGMVSSSLLWRRYYKADSDQPVAPVFWRFAAVVASAFGG